jgi:hypothetical protein
MNKKLSHWIVILQEHELEFTTPKRKKYLVLTEILVDFPYNSSNPLFNEDFPDEKLFLISFADPWYDDTWVHL